MGQFIIRRVLQMIPLLVLISFLLFGLFALIPGNFVDNNTSGKAMTPEKIEALKERYGINDKLHVRYYKWGSAVLKGDLGESFKYRKPVTAVIGDYIWNSFFLALFAQLFSILFAVPIGIYSATKPQSLFDKIFTVFAFLGIAMPSFFLGLLMIKTFAVDHRFFPVGGMTSPGSKAVGFAYLKDVAHHMVLPVFVLGFIGIGGLMRYTRTAMLEVVKQDYVRTARAKGLAERDVIYKHAFRNALIPVITLLGFMIPGLFAGAILTESIFGWPGIGKITLDAISSRDYFLVIGFNMILVILTLLGNLIADLLYAAADPRVRLQ